MKKNKRLKKFFNSYKPLIFASIIINIILLLVLYFNNRNNTIYTFSGSGDYVEVNDGLIVLNNDINIINGNNLKYIKDEDYEVSTFKIGYYVMDEKKLVELISNTVEIDESISFNDIIDRFTTLNLVEKDKDNNYFTQYKKKLIKDGLYLVIEAKTVDNEIILDRVAMNVSKISKY